MVAVRTVTFIRSEKHGELMEELATTPESRGALSSIAGDVLALILGLSFFSITVGWEKLDPRNLAWLTFGDQRAQLLGWWFFADDRWRWPLGANPNYGWEQMNSIVYTDSIPGLAIVFKALNLEVFDTGQYSGISLLLGSLGLFVGARRLFSRLGLSFWPALFATMILGTTPVFWWMQRWYVALSTGVALIVWATLFYLDDQVPLRRMWRRWLVLLTLAIAVQAYLLIPIGGVFAAVLMNRFLRRKDKQGPLLLVFLATGVFCVAVMYVLGYYTVPSKWAQTGGYGWYSANILGLLDSNGASQLVPDIPSISGQYEPTSLATGTLLLLLVLGVHRLINKSKFPLRVWLSQHAPLLIVLVVLFALAVTNTVSFGSWSVRIPIPQRLEHGLSVFRSSARFVWPLVVIVTVLITVFVARRVRCSAAILALVLLIQVFDYSPQLVTVSTRPDGRDIDIRFSEEFWIQVPSRYNVIATHPAASLGHNWAECAYAAVMTERRGQCGYFGRVQGLESVNQVNSAAFFDGALEDATVYWVSVDWLQTHRDRLALVYPTSRNDTRVHQLESLGAASILVFSGCGSKSCSFLGQSDVSLGSFLSDL